MAPSSGRVRTGGKDIGAAPPTAATGSLTTPAETAGTYVQIRGAAMLSCIAARRQGLDVIQAHSSGRDRAGPRPGHRTKRACPEGPGAASRSARGADRAVIEHTDR